MLKIAVQMDPIAQIKIAGDTTFALLLEAQARGHQLFYYTPADMSFSGNTLTAHLSMLQVKDEQGSHATLGAPQRTDLSQMDVVLLRQDPPFDMAYVTTTHLLEKIHPETLVVNDPASVRNAPEKIYVTEFSHLMPETLITRSRADIEDFITANGDVVMKPLYGHGGASVFKTGKNDPNKGALVDLFAGLSREPWMVQRFLPDISKGDKRIVLIDGVFAGALNRVPAEGDIRANLVRGGTGSVSDLSAREREICDELGPHLKAKGLLLVGIDVIGGYLTEINVTSPTGLRAITRQSGVNMAGKVVDAIKARRR